MHTLVDAFQFFDAGNRGWITRADVEAALGDAGAAAAAGGGGARGVSQSSAGGGGGASSQRASGGSFSAAGSHRAGSGIDGNAHAHAHPHVGAGGPAPASRRRFSEMDFDRNGRVSFPEFVAALESWAGVDEE
jgi:hypothetical protein